MPNTVMMRLAKAPHSDTLLMKVWYSTSTRVSAGYRRNVMPIIMLGLYIDTLLICDTGS